MANPNVFQQFLQQPPSAFDYADRFAAADTARQQNAMNQLVMGEKVRAIEDQNRLRQLYSQNPNLTSDQLRQAGFRDEANKVDAAALEKRKTESEIGYKSAQTSKEQVEAQAKVASMAYEKIGRHAQNIALVQTPEDVIAYVDQGIRDGVPGFTPEMREQAAAKLRQLGSVDAWKAAATKAATPIVDQFKQAADDARAKLQADTQLTLQGNVLQDTPDGPVVVNKPSSTARPVTYAKTGANQNGTTATDASAGYGTRADGTQKGRGFLGELKRPDGGVSTEISVGVNIGGKETEIPTLVPTLTRSEIDYLLSGGRPTEAIVDKAVKHAKERMAMGKSPFASESEAPRGAQPPADVIAQLTKSLYQQESGSGTADTSKPNNAGAIGPMQMRPGTFDGLKRQGLIPDYYDINDKKHNIAAGDALIRQLWSSYGDPAKVAAAYYGGPGAINPDGTINRNRRDPRNPNAPTVGQYVDQVVGRMSAGDPSQAAPGSRVRSGEPWSEPKTLTRQDGTPVAVQYNKRTGEVREVPGFGPKPGTEKPLNDTQSKALLFGSRMQEADKLLNALAKDGVDRPSAFKQGVEGIPWIGAGLGAAANATVVGSKQQQVEQAQRDFINAVLRRESGAVIGESEFESARKQYFPQIGDDDATKAQKARNRQLAIQGVLAEVPANQRNSLSAQSANKPLVANNGWSVVEVK